MREKDWKNVKEIFLAASERPFDERAKFIVESCGEDIELKNEVESLLAAHDSDTDFIETPAVDLSSILSNEKTNGAGKTLGNYKIVREIGRGGMGVVFLAERADGEFQQRVALKVLRQTLPDAEIIRYFKREREILASLNHPLIARLLDGGLTDDGLPFFVMEYVEGESVLEYATRENLSIAERLRLFEQICAAVGFAHRNFIVHRDIKTTNILVTADGTPKLLDFGLAKMLNTNFGEMDALQTETVFPGMTPAYASPEQLRGSPITTASDIYSLGVVLFELLTGQRPYQFKTQDLAEVIHVVCESNPVRPSSVVLCPLQNQDSTQSNEQRTKDNGQRTKLLRGDIDNIVLTALRKEPSRRYQTAEHFAEDIERHLNGLPVKARPNTFSYRAEKFIKRNKIAAVAAVLIFLTLLGGIVVSVWQARIAQREKAKAEIVNEFLQNMLNYSDNSLNLSRPKGQDMTVKDVLNEASKRLETEDLSSQPEIKAELQRIIGSSYLSQGNYDLAEKNLRSALEMETKIYGENSVESLESSIELGQLYVATADNANAEKIYQQKLSILRREQQKGAINPAYLLVALNDFAVLRRAQGNSKEAETLLREGLELKSQIPPENRITIGIAESVFALILSDQGKFEEAEKIVRERITEIRQQPNSETLELASNLKGFGNFLMEKGELANAQKNLLEAETIYRKLSNPTYLPLGDNLRLQAQVFYFQENYAEAENKINEALKIYRESSTPKYINFPTALTVQGLIFNRTNRTAEAEKILREAIRIRTESLPREHFLSAFSIGALGEGLTTQKRFDEAESLLQESYESLKNSQGAQNPRTILAQNRLVKLYRDWNKPELAAGFLEPH